MHTAQTDRIYCPVNHLVAVRNTRTVLLYRQNVRKHTMGQYNRQHSCPSYSRAYIYCGLCKLHCCSCFKTDFRFNNKVFIKSVFDCRKQLRKVLLKQSIQNQHIYSAEIILHYIFGYMYRHLYYAASPKREQSRL